MESFEYTQHPARVIFGSDSLQKLPGELERLHIRAPLLLSTPGQVGQAERVRALLDTNGVTAASIFAEATMHTPTSVTERAVAHARAAGADGLVSIGGGSTIGLGKAVSVRTGLPHVCVPTTYAGSEMTPILGETCDGRKTTRSDPAILPAAVIYEVDLTCSLPPPVSAASGVNAIAHAVEALYARNTNPIITLLALEGIRSLSHALPNLVTTSSTSSTTSSSAARTPALYGAWLCGTCLGAVGMALHHKLCHTLGGSFALPHAPTHTILLPHALAYNAPALPASTRAQLAAALPPAEGEADAEAESEKAGQANDLAVRRLNALIARLGGIVPRALRDLGMAEADIDRAADLAVANPYWNPRPVEREKVRELIRRAWAGEEARADL